MSALGRRRPLTLIISSIFLGAVLSSEAVAQSIPATINLGSLDGVIGFRLDGAAGSQAGYGISVVGDFNGDGLDDFVVGAYGDQPNGIFSGSSYVVFGKHSPFAATLQLASLSGSDGFRLDGAATRDFSGHHVSGAGDVNGDGLADLIIGAHGADPNGSSSGSSYVVFGRKAPFDTPLALSSLDGSNGFRLDGEAADDVAGREVSAAGDINGDGIDDLAVGAPWTDTFGSTSGTTYVVFGRSTPFAPALSLGALDGSNGFRLDGVAAGDFSGREISAAGDINGDGVDDLIIGSPFADINASAAGSSHVVFGKATPFSASLPLAGLDGSNGFRMNGSTANQYVGFSVSSAGDVNGDGLDDLIVGAIFANPNENYTGSAYVVFGTTTPFSASWSLSTLNGTNGFRLDGVAAFDRTGSSVSAGGDFNRDGFDDLIVGAYTAEGNGDDSGSAYVVFGKSTPFAPVLPLSMLDGSNGIRIDGASAGDNAGHAVSGSGDINGDGYSDLIIGAPEAAANGQHSGSVYVVFGGGAGLFADGFE